ncbi:MAG: peptide-methionine (R)-S-oxide reductase MsrB [Pseudonocardia sp.]
MAHTDQQWRERLTAEQYHVLREAGTERPRGSPLNAERQAGTFSCAGCALDLYSSTTKFDSGTGWPSFWKALDDAVVERTDRAMLIPRTEVLCHRCGGHLGHVFKDGPRPAGAALLHERRGHDLPRHLSPPGARGRNDHCGDRVVVGVKVDIWSDIVCPWCAIGRARFEAAGRLQPPVTGVPRVLLSRESASTAPRAMSVASSVSRTL